MMNDARMDAYALGDFPISLALDASTVQPIFWPFLILLKGTIRMLFLDNLGLK